MPEMQIPPVTAQYYGNVSSKIMDLEKSEGNSRLLYKPVIQFRHKDWDAKFLTALSTVRIELVNYSSELF